MTKLFNDPNVYSPMATRCAEAGWRALVERHRGKWSYAIERRARGGAWAAVSRGGWFPSAKSLARELATETDGAGIPVCAGARDKAALEKVLRALTSADG